MYFFLQYKVAEEWEQKEITEADRLKYVWEETRSKQNIVKIISKTENKSIENPQELIDKPQVQDYKKSLSKMFDEGETKKNLEAYKTSVLNLLKLNSNSLKA